MKVQKEEANSFGWCHVPVGPTWKSSPATYASTCVTKTVTFANKEHRLFTVLCSQTFIYS